MRVALISEHASPLADLGGPDAGGQNRHVADLALALARLGHDVQVCTRRDDPGLAGEVEVHGDGDVGYRVVHVPAGPAAPVAKDDLLPYMDAFGAWLGLQWAAGAWSPDVVHAHFWMSGLAARVATAVTPCPVVMTYHALGSVKRRQQGPADPSPAGRSRIERDLGRSVDRVVAQCSDEVFELLRMGVPRDSVSVVPSGVDLGTHTPDGPRAPRGDRPRVLAVGRLVPRKGLDVLVRALALVPDAELVVAGGPPADRLDRDHEAARLRGVARACGVADRVRLLGSVRHEELPAWYRSADLFATTPWYEPFGLTPLEAMACGLPVVAAAVGGLKDTVTDGVTGLLVPPRDVAATGTALRALLAAPQTRAQYAGRALARVRSRYGWDRIAATIASIYAGAAEPRTRRPGATATR